MCYVAGRRVEVVDDLDLDNEVGLTSIPISRVRVSVSHFDYPFLAFDALKHCFVAPNEPQRQGSLKIH
jgi:hypothetical protein